PNSSSRTSRASASNTGCGAVTMSRIAMASPCRRLVYRVVVARAGGSTACRAVPSARRLPASRERMTERVEDLPPRGSKLPLAMAGAFAIGAGVAGWFMFKEDLAAWSRVEDFAWSAQSGEQLSLLQTQRIDREITGLPTEIIAI